MLITLMVMMSMMLVPAQKELRDVLVEHFRGMDLVAGISGHIIDRLTISWKTDEAK